MVIPKFIHSFSLSFPFMKNLSFSRLFFLLVLNQISLSFPLISHLRFFWVRKRFETFNLNPSPPRVSALVSLISSIPLPDIFNYCTD
ncbi:hypothetical protein BDV32DRAFT_17317 [Aspergillus pseudonomiae]|nr:hypothetical protein BDV32DRAFT_17317 [Aspergillus pseudonomiae]